jgi:hypothetical protein
MNRFYYLATNNANDVSFSSHYSINSEEKGQMEQEQIPVEETN